MGVELIEKEKELTAVLKGDIDHHSAKEIRESIDMQAEKHKPKLLKLDFKQVDFMDSSGIGLIMGRYKLMQLLGGKLRVVNVPGYIRRVIKLSGLDQLGVLDKEVTEHESEQ
jgi:stage II sporulation protein AA (anti-sigma F factor antagonist)